MLDLVLGMLNLRVKRKGGKRDFFLKKGRGEKEEKEYGGSMDGLVFWFFYLWLGLRKDKFFFGLYYTLYIFELKDLIGLFKLVINEICM